MFQSKLHSSADQILFEFDGFCKPQNIKRQIHFNTRGGGYIRGGRGLDRRAYIWGAYKCGGGAYNWKFMVSCKYRKYTWSWRSLPFHFSAHCQQKTWRLPVNPMAWQWTLWLNVLNRYDNVIKIECHNFKSDVCLNLSKCQAKHELWKRCTKLSLKTNLWIVRGMAISSVSCMSRRCLTAKNFWTVLILA